MPSDLRRGVVPGALRRERPRSTPQVLRHHRQPDPLVHPALPLGPEQCARHRRAREGRVHARLRGGERPIRRGGCGRGGASRRQCRPICDGGSFQVRFVENDPEAHHKFYAIIANPILWFIQHYLWDQSNAPDIGEHEKDAFTHGYVAVNDRFAEAVAGEVERLGGNAVRSATGGRSRCASSRTTPKHTTSSTPSSPTRSSGSSSTTSGTRAMRPTSASTRRTRSRTATWR